MEIKTRNEVFLDSEISARWIKLNDVREIQFQVQKWCIRYFDMDTKEIIKLNKLLKIKELK